MENSVEQASRTGTHPLGELVEEHRQCSRKLESILSHTYLSQKEQIEAARLKKMKLQLKDKMARWARPSRENPPFLFKTLTLI